LRVPQAAGRGRVAGFLSILAPAAFGEIAICLAEDRKGKSERHVRKLAGVQCDHRRIITQTYTNSDPWRRILAFSHSRLARDGHAGREIFLPETGVLPLAAACTARENPYRESRDGIGCARS